jgi:hypothetical protein
VELVGFYAVQVLLLLDTRGRVYVEDFVRLQSVLVVFLNFTVVVVEDFTYLAHDILHQLGFGLGLLQCEVELAHVGGEGRHEGQGVLVASEIELEVVGRVGVNGGGLVGIITVISELKAFGRLFVGQAS